MKRTRTNRFLIIRTVTAGRGINAEIELSATDATAAENIAAAHFSHEEGVTAKYTVKRINR